MKYKLETPEKRFVNVVNKVCGQYHNARVSFNVIQQNTNINICVSVSRCTKTNGILNFLKSCNTLNSITSCLFLNRRGLPLHQTQE